MEIENDDLEMTRELCRRPGALKQDLQETYSIVRSSVRLEVLRRELSPAERAVIVEELRRLGTSANAEADALRDSRGPTLVRRTCPEP